MRSARRGARHGSVRSRRTIPSARTALNGNLVTDRHARYFGPVYVTYPQVRGGFPQQFALRSSPGHPVAARPDDLVTSRDDSR
ncbi:hypothetical protein T261_1946 [Streptomyces lydicus]|nr:hypothetical protein T261_1946 [Streptomyces lydicus]